MKLYFLRHGLAGERSEWRGNDFDRPLTDEGKTITARSASTLAALDLDLDGIVTSPLVRARQTAEIVAEVLHVEKLIEDPRLEPGFDARALLDVLKAHPGASALMLVGHEPDFSTTLNQLTGGRVVLKKGGLACVDLPEADRPQGDLLWLIPPKILALRRRNQGD